MLSLSSQEDAALPTLDRGSGTPGCCGRFELRRIAAFDRRRHADYTKNGDALSPDQFLQ
jgi:hypothetical protein